METYAALGTAKADDLSDKAAVVEHALLGAPSDLLLLLLGSDLGGLVANLARVGERAVEFCLERAHVR